MVVPWPGREQTALFVLGTIAMFTGDYSRAVSLFERSLAERRGRGDEHTAARHLGGLGSALLNLGDPDRSRGDLIESAGLFASTGNMVYLTWCLEGLAGVAAAGSRFGRAGYEPMLATVRDNLGADEFSAAHDRLAGRPPPELIAAVTEEEAEHE
jgi:hypothetical protein